LLTDVREVIVLQLQLLDLGIRKEDVAVPIDITVRTELIDLMARILVVVFQAEEGRVHDGASIQSQDQAGALGSQSYRLLTAIQRETGTAE
jgi:hypothetical protein